MNTNFKSTIVQRVHQNVHMVEKFLGYGQRAVPPVIGRKIQEELAIFADYLRIQLGYTLLQQVGENFVNLLYTVGSPIEDRINQYIESSEGMRAMILDKIAIVALNEIKASVLEEIQQQHGLYPIKEFYPRSKALPLSVQKEILESVEHIDGITINEYYQLFPLKTVALRIQLAPQMQEYNRCQDCQNPCETKEPTPQEVLESFVQKAENYTKKRYEEAGISLAIYEDNIKDISIWAAHYEKSVGTKGIAKKYWKWIDDILELNIIKLGRLQFEPLDMAANPELIQLFPNQKILFLNVHIRSEEALDSLSCQDSYQQAIQFFSAKYPEFPKIVFICDSWLLNPNLSALLPSNSNILDFRKPYTLLSKDENNRQMEERVFGFVGDDFSLRPAFKNRSKKL